MKQQMNDNITDVGSRFGFKIQPHGVSDKSLDLNFSISNKWVDSDLHSSLSANILGIVVELLMKLDMHESHRSSKAFQLSVTYLKVTNGVFRWCFF